MKLYEYHHCPFCVRVRMVLARKFPQSEIIALPYDEAEIPMALIGKKKLPILIKDDGEAMAESLDIIEYLEQMGDGPILDSATLPDDFSQKLSELKPEIQELLKPRYPKLSIADFSTASAIAYFEKKHSKTMNLSFDAAKNKTEELTKKIQPTIDWFNQHIPNAEHLLDKLSYADIHFFPAVRSLTMIPFLELGDNLSAYINRQCEAALLKPYPVIK